MSLISRIEKLEEQLDRLNIGVNRPPGVIRFKRDPAGNELYRIDKDKEQVWVNEQELDHYLAQFEDYKGIGPIILVREKN